jgi:hypothetical protein
LSLRDRNLPTPVHEIDSSPPDSIEDEDDEYEDEQPPLTSHALSLLAQIG